jgi:cytochrome c-type biogenesis protein CcmH/NrfF
MIGPLKVFCGTFLMYNNAMDSPTLLFSESDKNKENLQAELFLKERARILFPKIRCLTCANQSIDSSNSEMAKQLRKEVYELLRSNPSIPQQEIFENLRNKHGTAVIYDLPEAKKSKTLRVIDFDPIALLGIIGISYSLYKLYRKIGPTTSYQAIKSILNQRYSSIESYPFTSKERKVLCDLILIPRKKHRVLPTDYKQNSNE